MNPYPSSVSAIVSDYLLRLKFHLQPVPDAEQAEFLREIESHIFEAYHEDSTLEEVPRILHVLNKLGEPSEVVAARLPDSMVRSGAKHHWPLRILLGLVLALFGLPLGLGGVAVLVGVYFALVGLLASSFIAATAIAVSGALVVILGFVRVNLPGLWDRLLINGVLRIDDPVLAFLEYFDPAAQGFLLLVLGTAIILFATAIFWLLSRGFRGFKSLTLFAFDALRRVAQKLRHHARSRRYALFWNPRLRQSLRF
jgi:hypothetical protein